MSPTHKACSAILAMSYRGQSSGSTYTPVDGDLVAPKASNSASEKRKHAMFEEISNNFGRSNNINTHGTELPPATNTERFSALDDSARQAHSEGPHSISGWTATPLVTMEESPITGVYIIRLNNPPVNTCTLEVLRGLLYCFYKLAGTFENDIKDPSKPNPWDRSGTARLNKCRGIILHSSVQNIFSAGMDLEELLSVGEDAEEERLQAKNKGTEETATSPNETPPNGNVPVGSSSINDNKKSLFLTPDGKRVPYASFVQYWGTLQHLQFTLLGYPVPVVAAISGDAPAGGCLLSMLCDYRVMAAKSAKGSPASSKSQHAPKDAASNEVSSKPPRLYKIGMTSVRAGFAVPPWIAATLRYTVGPKHAEEILTQSVMATAEEAKNKYGLIDQISESDETVLMDALSSMEYLLANIPFQHTFWFVKETCRRPLIDLLETKDKRLDDASNYIAHLSNSEVYGKLKSYKAALGAGKKKKSAPPTSAGVSTK